MDTIKVKFMGNEHNYPKGTKFYEISKDCHELTNIVAFKRNNQIHSLGEKLTSDCEIEFINYNDINGYKIYKEGLKFIFEVALKETFPKLDISYEHSVPRGMLGIIKGTKILTTDDISKIKEKMASIIAEDITIEKLNVLPDEAIRYYETTKVDEKKLNVQNINDKMVTLYKLNNYLNYFYSEMPYKTGVVNKFDLVYLGNNKIIFLFPNKYSDGSVPEYVHYDKIIESFAQSKKWLNELKMPYITNLNQTIGNGKIKKFIKSSEIKFNLALSRVAKDISDRKDVKFVMVSGPSSSGKTTTSERLSSYLEALGYNTIKISVDDYFVDREKTPKDEDGNYDFECLRAIDLELFNNDLMRLLNKETIHLPKFNFITGKREVSKEQVSLSDNTILVIEGLHALNDELTPAIDSKYKYKIYLSPFISLNIDRHNYISTLDLRLLRRIIRDNRTRGYEVSKTIESWQSVRRGEDKYIFPYIHQADVIVNTSLAYEVGVLKVFVEPLLYSVGIDNVYYEEARRLLDSLKQFYPIPGEYVPDESIIREFIGGKYND